MATKTKLAIRVSSDLKPFVGQNSLIAIIRSAFKNQFQDIDFHFPDEQQSLNEVKTKFSSVASDIFILNLDAHAKTLDESEGFDLHISRLFDCNAQFKGFVNREGSKPIQEQIQEAKEAFQKSGKRVLVIYDEDNIAGFLNDLIKKEFKSDFPDLHICCERQVYYSSEYEILDLKDFIINCRTISSGLLIQRHSLSSIPQYERVPYTYNDKLLQVLGSVDPKNYLNVLHLTLTLSLLYAEENFLSIEDVLETYREITSKLYDEYYN